MPGARMFNDQPAPRHRHARQACPGCAIGAWRRMVNGILTHADGTPCTDDEDDT